MKDPCDFKVMFRKRVHIHDRVAADGDLLTHSEAAFLRQVLLYNALFRILRKAALQQYRDRDLFRQGEDLFQSVSVRCVRRLCKNCRPDSLAMDIISIDYLMICPGILRVKVILGLDLKPYGGWYP